MRIRILSDLHVEVAAFQPEPVDADLVVLAGDIHNGEMAPHWARRAFPDSEILMIAGNHEFYDGEYWSTLETIRAAASDCGIHFLENESVRIGGVRFLGCTLWTDFRLFESPGRPLSLSADQAIEESRRKVPDFRTIRFQSDGVEHPFDGTHWRGLHAASRAWLEQELARPFAGRTVVVSHHLPSWRSVHPEFSAWASNAAFASELDPLVERADLWVHGHTHTTQRYRVGRAEIVCNPRGYPRKGGGHKRAVMPGDDELLDQAVVFENPRFDPSLVVDLDIG